MKCDLCNEDLPEFLLERHIEQVHNSIITSLNRTSPRILDNLGITIKLREIPEWLDYYNYVYGAGPLRSLYRRIFRREEVERKLLAARVGILAAVLDNEPG